MLLAAINYHGENLNIDYELRTTTEDDSNYEEGTFLTDDDKAFIDAMLSKGIINYNYLRIKSNANAVHSEDEDDKYDGKTFSNLKKPR